MYGCLCLQLQWGLGPSWSPGYLRGALLNAFHFTVFAQSGIASHVVTHMYVPQVEGSYFGYFIMVPLRNRLAPVEERWGRGVIP